MEEIVVAVDRADPSRATALRATSLGTQGWHERAHLQQWVLAHPEVLGSGVVVLAEEFDQWETAGGARLRDRLDVLGIDSDGMLVVAELKRDRAPETVNMQALNYAAMVSRFTTDDIVGLYAGRHTGGDREKALQALTEIGLDSEATTRKVRVVLVASDFPPSVMQTAIWLGEQGIKLSLVRFRPYALDDGQVVVSFSRILPVPDAEDFTVRRLSAPKDLDEDEDSPDWDEPTLRELERQSNEVTKALLDLLVASDGIPVTVVDVQEHLKVSTGSVRGQLAGLTMLLRRTRNPIGPRRAPWRIVWQEGGVANYYLDGDLADLWRRLRGLDTADQDQVATLPRE